MSAYIAMECRVCGESIRTSRDEAAIAFTHEHKTLHLLAPGVFCECPHCGRSSEWTNGLSVAAGDDRDEFWCQVCGSQTPFSFGIVVGLESVQRSQREVSDE